MPIGAFISRCGLAVLGFSALVGCTVTTSPTAYTPAPPPPPAPEYAPLASDEANGADIVIYDDSDFYQPLEPYGVWYDVSGYGRCWRPRDVGRDWHPYTNGQWVATDDGWYWESSESWGWATCHYGRWDRDSDGVWFWVPQTQWAPAWVAWRQGGGYCGWAPLPPSRGVSVSLDVEIAPAAFVFVSEQHFSEPMRPTSLIINNTTIISQTTVIRKTQTANRVTFNAGPSRDTISRAQGHPVQTVPARQVRAKEDARIAVRPKPSNRVATAPGQGPKPGSATRAQDTSRPPGAGGHPVNTEEERTRSNPGAYNAPTQNSESEAKAKAKASEQVKAEAETKARASEQAKAQAEEKAKEKALDQAKADQRAEAEEKAKANLPAKTGADTKDREQEKASVQAQGDEAAKAKAKAKAAAKAKADAERKAEEERKAQAEKEQQSKGQQ